MATTWQQSLRTPIERIGKVHSHMPYLLDMLCLFGNVRPKRHWTFDPSKSTKARNTKRAHQQFLQKRIEALEAELASLQADTAEEAGRK